MSLAIAIQCESGMVCRNVRALESITEEFDANSVPYVQAEKKMGSWDIVLAFHNQEALESFQKGDLKAPWDKKVEAAPVSINPLKASKRAARGG